VERLLLADIRGNKRFLEKLIDREIYTPRGRLVGKIWKIYVSKKSKKPIKLIVKVPGGGRISIDPGKVVVEGGNLILKVEDSRRLSELFRELKSIVRRVRSLHEELLLANEKLVNGEMGEREYKIIRGKIDSERAKYILRAQNILSEIELMRRHGEIRLTAGEERLLSRLVDYLKNSVVVLPSRELEVIFTDTRF